MSRWTHQDLQRYESKRLAPEVLKSTTFGACACDDEAKLQEEIAAECARRGWLVIRSRMDRKTTTPIGTPDLIIFAEHGRVLSVECKSKTGKVTVEQLATGRWMKKLGQRWGVVRSMPEFFALLYDVHNLLPDAVGIEKG